MKGWSSLNLALILIDDSQHLYRTMYLCNTFKRWWLLWKVSGPVHKGSNHVPKAISTHDPLPDWVRDLNNVRSQALQLPSQSRTGYVHCEVLVHALIDPLTLAWLQCGISQTHTHESCSEKTLRSQVLRIRLFRRITIQKNFASQKPDLKELCIHKG